MTALRIKTVEEKLQKLQEFIDKLEELKKISYDQFINESIYPDAAMRNLQVGVEVIIDIGTHILSEIFQVKVSEYKEAIQKLGEAGVVPKEFAKEHIPMAKFRNLLVHEYGDIDIVKVYEYLQKAPDIFRQFAKYYVEFLEKELVMNPET